MAPGCERRTLNQTREHLQKPTFEVDREIVYIEDLDFLLAASLVVQIEVETIRKGEHRESIFVDHF